MKGIDYTVSTTSEIAKALKEVGIDFVCRYLVSPKYSWKRLTKSEAEILSSYDLKILSIYEANANSVLRGINGGTNDGKEAYAEAQLIGQPVGSTIYFAVDYDAQSKDYDIIEAYAQAFATQIPGYNVGIYGSYAICEEFHKRGIKYCWQTYAWSKGKKSSHMNVYQYKNSVSLGGIKSVDLDESFGNEGFWNVKGEDKVLNLESIVSKKKVIATTLNVRETPDVTSKDIGDLKQGDIITVTGKKDKWYRINFNGFDAFVFSDYVQDFIEPDYKLERDMFKKANEELVNKINNVINLLK